MENDKVVRAYIAIRDKRTQLRKAYEAEDDVLKEKLHKLEVAMLRFLNDTGMESARTQEGTFYQQVDVRPMGSDWDAFYRWVRENDAFDALERRIKKGFITDYMEENDGDLPPGVSIHRERVVRVRKAS